MVNSTLTENCLLVTGAKGRIGRLLRHLWADRPVVWSGRKSDLAWDMGRGTAPDLPKGTRILHLAGTTGGDLGQNETAARALARVLRPGHRLVLVSSIAVYGRGDAPFREEDPPAPAGDYAAAKLQVEELLAPVAPLVLRLGNLFGADAMTRSAREGRVMLDQAPGGQGPVRSWIGPVTLGRVLWELLEDPRPGLLNLAQPPALAMAELLQAMGAAFDFGPRAAPVPRAEMALDRLAARLDLPPATPEGLVAELRSLERIWP